MIFSRRGWIIIAVLLIDVVVIALAWWVLRIRQPEQYAANADGAKTTAPTLPAGPAEDEVVGPLVLAVGEDGQALRATVGNCWAPGQVRVWAWDLEGEDASLVETPEGMAQVRQAIVDDDLTLIGFDEACEPVRATSADGQNWSVSQLRDPEWFYVHRPVTDGVAVQPRGEDAGATATAEHTEDIEPEAIMCDPVSVSRMPDGEAVVNCGQGRFISVKEDGSSTEAYAAGRTTAYIPSDDRQLFGTMDPACKAQILVRKFDLDDPNATVDELTCIDPERAVTALARWGDTIVAQVGNSLLLSDAGIGDWQPLG